MTHDLILHNIANHISLDKEEKDYFISLLKPRQFAKKISYKGRTGLQIHQLR
jgi:hypothetical protein